MSLRLALLLLPLLATFTAWAELPAISSTEQEGVLSARVESTLPYDFDTLAPALARTENWCQIMPLHFNIKACTHQQGQLTVYSGRKVYQSPEQSYQIAYAFETIGQTDDQLTLRLSADEGPVGTRDYRIELQAERVAGGTRLRMSSSYRPSWLSSMLTSGYLSTLGRDKVGFSRVEKGELVRGIRGVIERNAMRYHFAINAFLNSHALPEASRHQAALQEWFKQNESHPEQLHEMDEEEYLAIKQKEWENQQRLQLARDERVRVATR